MGLLKAMLYFGIAWILLGATPGIPDEILAGVIGALEIIKVISKSEVLGKEKYGK